MWERWVSFGWFVSILIRWKGGQVGQISLSNNLNQCSLVHPWQGCVLSLTWMTFITWIFRVVIVQMSDRDDDCQVCPCVHQSCLCWKIIHELTLLQMNSSVNTRGLISGHVWAISSGSAEGGHFTGWNIHWIFHELPGWGGGSGAEAGVFSGLRLPAQHGHNISGRGWFSPLKCSPGTSPVPNLWRG